MLLGRENAHNDIDKRHFFQPGVAELGWRLAPVNLSRFAPAELAQPGRNDRQRRGILSARLPQFQQTSWQTVPTFWRLPPWA